jgi:hypothetical protein
VAAVPAGARSEAVPGTTLYVTVSVELAVLFAASRATTVITVAPIPNGTPAIDHAVVPVATPLAPRSVDQLTCVTATSSLADPLTVRGVALVVYVPLLTGEAIATAGAVVSGGIGTVNAIAALHGPTPDAFDARIHHTAAPDASVTAGLMVHVPVLSGHPTATAV